MASFSEQLARWLLTLRFEDLPEDVVESTKLRVLDTIGLALGSSVLDYGRAVREAALEMGGVGGTAHVLGFGDMVAPMLAALVNGALAEGFLYDDTHNETMINVSAPIVATALAIGEHVHASGADVLTAIAAGNEVTCRIGCAAPGAFHRGGFHPTGIVGTLGATFVACRLLGLDMDRTRHAIGIAGSQAAGINESWVDGTWTQLMHPGWAAHGGIAAALLGKNGFTGPATVLEGRHGVFHSHVQDPGYPFDFERMVAKLGRDWESRYISFKPYPCAHVLHAYVDALLHLIQHEGLKPDKVKQITCPVAEYMIPLVCEPQHEKLAPQTYIQARGSLQYVLAEALHFGKVDFRSFNTRNISNTDILGLAQKIAYVIDPDAPGSWQYRGWVVVETTDGKTLERVEEHNRGSPENPLSVSDLAVKFQENCSLALPNKVDAIIDAVIALDQLPTIAELIDHAVRVDAVRKVLG
ncbi:MAG: MmgE/PrpD family protein [Proteobacteria bacterium]|nr:MmgE/PrpD family protein [Pseudomonadota bacterium]